MTTPDQPALLARIALAFGLFFRVLFNAPFAGRVLAPRQRATPAAPRRACRRPRPSRPKLRERRRDAGAAAARPAAARRPPHRLPAGRHRRLRRRRDRRRRARRARGLPQGAARARAARARAQRGRRRARQRARGLRAERGPPHRQRRRRRPPFTGTLRHRGWRAAEHRAAASSAEGHDARVLAPAEVEL